MWLGNSMKQSPFWYTDGRSAGQVLELKFTERRWYKLKYAGICRSFEGVTVSIFKEIQGDAVLSYLHST